MAIKGKRKPKGGQARRRPATAPRAQAMATHRGPWWKTTAGGAAIVVALVAIAVLVAYIVIDNQRDADKLADRQEALENYLDQLRAEIQSVDAVAAEMTGVGAAADADPAKIADDAKRWSTELEEAQIAFSQIQAPPSEQIVNSLLQQTIGLYSSAAKTYRLAPDVGEEGLVGILERAAELRSQAVGLFTTATQELEGALLEAELDPSGLQPPGTGAPPPSPAPSPASSPTADDNEGGNPGGGKGKGKGKGDKDGGGGKGGGGNNGTDDDS